METPGWSSRGCEPAGMAPEAPAPRPGKATGSEPAATGPALPPGDQAILLRSFNAADPAAGKAMSYFYSMLFTAHPQLRAMFPLAMDDRRQALATALARCAWSLDDPPSLHGYLAWLAREHRKFGVRPEQYRLFGELLGTALRLSYGAGWTAHTAAAWQRAVAHFCSVMAEAARAMSGEPPWWVAEVVRHDRRRGDLAVLTLRPGAPFPYQPGQYLSVQVTRWPRTWRRYSIANAPRPDGTLDLHVRAVPGGQVSTALVQQTRAGDAVLLGPAQGSMVAGPDLARGLLLVAGGTGLAPLKAIIEGLAAGPAAGARPAGAAGPAPARGIQLFFGARRQDDLYDLPDLERLRAACPGLEIITALSEEQAAGARHGRLPDLVAGHAAGADCDVYLSGPPGMIQGMLRVLAQQDVAGQVHLDLADPWAQTFRHRGTQAPSRTS